MTSPTLVLERAMLDPRFAQVVATIRAAMPSHQRDQADAAIDAATASVLKLNELISDDPTRVAQPGDIPGWLRLSVLDAFVSFAQGAAATCRHNPDPRYPTPVYAAVWKPGLITCGYCLHLFSLGRGSAADCTCDSCGRVCVGQDDSDAIHPGLIQLGPVVVQYGACSDCTLSTPGVVLQRLTHRGSHGRGRGRKAAGR
jgi:hypothetical protein